MTEQTKISNVTLRRIVPKVPFHPVYYGDQPFQPVMDALNGNIPTEVIPRDQIKRVLPKFSIQDQYLIHENSICLLRESINELLLESHDSRVSRNFGVLKTLYRLMQHHWRHKLRDLTRYCHGCLCFQQQTDMTYKKLGVLTPLDVPRRRWGSVGTYCIVSIPTKKDGFYRVFKWVDRLTRPLQFIPSMGTDTEVDVAQVFFSQNFQLSRSN